MDQPQQLDFNEICDLLGIDEFHEDSLVEVKFGLGEDGNTGQLPDSFFPSYSAMANSQGGIIVLGFREISDGVFDFIGFKNPDHILRQLWSSLNNSNKVSVNLLANKDVEVLESYNKKFIKVSIPPANRKQKPVFHGSNPFSGTYRRDFDGDHLCDEETVKRMLAEQIEDTLDSRILLDYDENDLDNNTVKLYRNAFSTVKPTHHYNLKDNLEFLRLIGALNVDRSTKKSGLTVAGLLMFGKFNSIIEEFPNYFLDYQEQNNNDPEKRWIDRVIPDGSWSGNLFDFYNIVIQKLSQNLKVSFIISGTTRIDESPIHIALREALTNTLIHADYKGRISITVIKRPDKYCFINPGTMRIPIPEAIHGGSSDCRNKRLQNMFTLIGRGERMGSGIPKIYKNWTDQTWEPPILKEKFSPDSTFLQLNMVDLLPEEIVIKLKSRFGTKFNNLNKIKKVALVIASVTGSIDHSRLKEVSMIHPKDITKELKELVEGGFLEPHGATRATVYFLPTLPADTIQQTISTWTEKPEFSVGSSVHGSVHHLHPNLIKIADKLGNKPSKNEIKKTILKLCAKRYLTVQDIAYLLKRSPHTIRTHYINWFVKNGYLSIRYPGRSHPKQAYLTIKQIKKENAE